MNNGENGALQYISSTNNNLDLFFHSVRKANIKNKLELCLQSDSSNDIAELFILAFQTRNCRGGKGEKKIFYDMILLLFLHYPETVLDLIHLVPQYGYYKDYTLLLHEMNNLPEYKRLHQKIISIIVLQIRNDCDELKKSQEENRKPNLSMIAKYAPRPNKEYKHVAKHIYNTMYSNHEYGQCKYRKRLSKLNKALNTTEIKMCSNNYSGILYQNVPSICMMKYRKAFLNEKIKRKHDDDENENKLRNGDRFPDNIDRVTSRHNLENMIKLKKINGKQVMPHEIVKQFINNKFISVIEENLLNVQWNDMKQNVLQNNTIKIKNTGLCLGNIIPLVDVSGSMKGIPMEVAIALGILISEINNPLFNESFITFETDPKLVLLKGLTLKEKVEKTLNSPWGGSTDVIKAIQLILRIVVDNKLTEKDIPDLLILSDMQFNNASKFDETSYEIITKLFVKAGMEICGKPYKTPNIIFWNLQGKDGVPVTSSHKNVQLLSGFSPSLLKSIIKCEDVTPQGMYQFIINNVLYEPIRTVLNKSQEKKLLHYSYKRI